MTQDTLNTLIDEYVETAKQRFEDCMEVFDNINDMKAFSDDDNHRVQLAVWECEKNFKEAIRELEGLKGVE